jgi:hypothetical protein
MRSKEAARNWEFKKKRLRSTDLGVKQTGLVIVLCVSIVATSGIVEKKIGKRIRNAEPKHGQDQGWAPEA